MYSRPERYYSGDHDLTFATEKFQNAFGSLFGEFAMNLCPAIVDAVKDKLIVRGFSVDDPVVSSQRVAVSSKQSAVGSSRTANSIDSDNSMQAGSLRSDANRIWRRNRMAIRAGELHKEVLKCGDAYMIVWPDARGRAVMYPNRAANVSVTYDKDSPGKIAWAAKYWRTADKRIRLNLFYPDRIEKYVSRNESEGALPDAKGFVALRLSSKLQVPGFKLGRWELGTVPNP